MHVVATAGHVDHGKSTLVRALTGMEPDRWAEERRRGMTIDLGYAWTQLAGDLLAFVDVPGHQRFIANMLAGLGPAPAVLFVVAADQGWQAQSSEHLAALDALGLTHGLLAVTRSDLADPGPALADAQARIARTTLGAVEAVAVSGASRSGLAELRAALGALVSRLPAPDVAAPVRLWVDRAFTITGAGTVVTGTLGAGTLTVGDELSLDGRAVRVRGLQSAGAAADRVAAVARVAVNLRGVARDDVARGATLRTPGRWSTTTELDVRLEHIGTGESGTGDVPPHGSGAGEDAGGAGRWGGDLMLHVGTAAVPARFRPLGASTGRLRLARPLPLLSGDRAVLRDPGSRAVTGLVVLDTDPPLLRRRGAARERGELLAGVQRIDAAAEVAHRGAVREQRLRELGHDPDRAGDVVRHAGWLIAPDRWAGWADALRTAAAAHAAAEPMAPALTFAAAARLAELPGVELVAPLAQAAGLLVAAGTVRPLGAAPSLGPAEAALRTLEQQLHDDPFRAPQRPDLDGLGLGPRQLAVAINAGRLLRIGPDVVLLPDAPQRAVHVLRTLPAPFSLSDARQALDTTRRVAVPLLEHLDALGITERVDATRRRVV